jgi:hypothetical protein
VFDLRAETRLRGPPERSRVQLDGETIMGTSVFAQLILTRPRAAGIAVAALAACGAALAPTGAAADYSFTTINDPADNPPPAGANGFTFTNLMGITNDPRILWQRRSRRSQHGIRAHVARQDVHPRQRHFPRVSAAA